MFPVANRKIKHVLVWLPVLMLIAGYAASCRRDYTPKPRGYFRIDLPEHAYRAYQSSCPFRFEYPVYAKIQADRDPGAEPCWFNIVYPQFRGQIHMSYKEVNGNIDNLIEDARGLVYKHAIKADAIGEQLYTNEEKQVYGILYDIDGNAASSVQFFLTDSTRHFIRGALYFNSIPNADSLAPVIRFCRQDIVHLIESFSWE